MNGTINLFNGADTFELLTGDHALTLVCQGFTGLAHTLNSIHGMTPSTRARIILRSTSTNQVVLVCALSVICLSCLALLDLTLNGREW